MENISTSYNSNNKRNPETSLSSWHDCHKLEQIHLQIKLIFERYNYLWPESQRLSCRRSSGLTDRSRSRKAPISSGTLHSFCMINIDSINLHKSTFTLHSTWPAACPLWDNSLISSKITWSSMVNKYLLTRLLWPRGDSQQDLQEKSMLDTCLWTLLWASYWIGSRDFLMWKIFIYFMTDAHCTRASELSDRSPSSAMNIS